MALIELRDINKTYDNGQPLHVLKGINLDIERGEFVSIMGASGSGKSTLLNILGILDNYDTGTYHLAGKLIKDLSEGKAAEYRNKMIGFIFQSFNLIPQLTVEENIALPLYYLGWGANERMKRAKELAELVGLGKRLGHRPTELSGGQQQRVAIARALSNDPVFLLADEPTGNLDSVNSVEIIELLKNLNREGKTIIMVTHDSDIAAHATKRLVMRDGKIQKIEE